MGGKKKGSAQLGTISHVRHLRTSIAEKASAFHGDPAIALFCVFAQWSSCSGLFLCLCTVWYYVVLRSKRSFCGLRALVTAEVDLTHWINKAFGFDFTIL